MSKNPQEGHAIKPNPDWLRLKRVIDSAGLSTNAFARSVGLKRAENLYQIKKGNYSISKELADRITTIYSNVNKAWLLTGEGEMLTGCRAEAEKIPYFDTGITQVDLSTNPVPTHYLDIPLFADCDLAVLHTGDSMAPDIPPGAIVVLKEVDLQAVLSGNIYLLVTDDYSITRSVRIKGADQGYLRLIPKNADEFDEITIEKEKVKRLFLVKGVISMRAT